MPAARVLGAGEGPGAGRAGGRRQGPGAAVEQGRPAMAGDTGRGMGRRRRGVCVRAWRVCECVCGCAAVSGYEGGLPSAREVALGKA